MQNVGTARIDTARPLYYRSRKTGYKPGNDPGGKNCSPERGCNDFLKSVIAPVYPQRITLEDCPSDPNLLTQANYAYLRDSAVNYARLLGQQFDYQLTGDLCGDMAAMYDALAAILPQHQHLNIEPCKDGLAFCIWQVHRWNDYTFYWLPIRFIDCLKGKFKRIVITFIHEFVHSNHIPLLYESYEIDWLLEIFGNSLLEENWDQDERRNAEKLLQSYSGGHILKLQKRVANRSYYKRLPAALERYEPQDGFEAKLIALMKRGLQFIGRDKPSIMSYQYAPDYDPGDEMIVSLDSLIRIIYDANDWIGEALSETVDCEIQNNNSMTPTSICYLCPQTAEIFVKDDYPERFCDWFSDFTEHIYSLNNE